MTLRAFRQWVAGALLAGVAALGHAQAANTLHSVAGRVQRPASAPTRDSSGMAPVLGALVTLHRVGKDTAGPVDSMRTAADGRFHFQWRPFGATDAVYFASVTWGGVAYFTPPLRNEKNEGSAADISVFDTTSSTFPISVRGRHLVVSAADSNDQRTVVEVFELSNDSLHTLVAGKGTTGAPTWSVAIPTTARDVKGGDGEVSPDTFVPASGRLSIFAALAPGIKQLSFSYHVPASSFPMHFAMEQAAAVLEVLVEEPRGDVSGAGLVAVDPVALERRNFRRFLAQDVPAAAIVTVELPPGRSVGRNLYIASLLVVIGAAMLLVLGRAMQRRRPLGLVVGSASRAPELPMADRLAREIVDLDAAFARHESPGDAVRDAYNSRRAELKDALAAELAHTRTTR